MKPKRVLINAFTKPKTKQYKIVNDFLAALTIVSIISLVLETVPSLSVYAQLFFVIEWIAVIFFSIEYICRLYVSNPSWKYSLSFFGLIDLIAILPTILGLGNFTFLKSARTLRIIRMLRMLRLAKIGRGGGGRDEEMGVMSLNILIYFVTLVFALLVTGTAIYLVEPEMVAFSSIPAGMWWSLKVFMAGIPVPTPETQIGEVFFVITRFVGLLLLGLLVGVVGNVFRVLLMGKK